MQKGYSTIITENGGYADLHMHTKLSDGNLSVEELLTLCKRKGLRCISITDHDNLDSYNLAVEPAKEIGLEIIPGIEISAVWQGKDIHILGYFCDPTNLALNMELQDFAKQRVTRAKAIIKKLNALGIDITYEEDGITVSRTSDLMPVDIQTLPFPGFPTDMQAQTMALLALAKGSCVVTENVFENRFMFASEIQRMGANITIEGHHAIVRGVPAYSGAEVQASDLRAGAALVIAGLVADGTTVVSNIHHIDRGYEKFVEKLQSLGAVARRTTRPDEDVFAD